MQPRRAGQHARAVAERHRTVGLLVLGFALTVAGAIAIGTGFAAGPTLGASAGLIAVATVVDRRLYPLLDRWSRGAKGEESVGELVSSLESAGWRALYDVDTGRGNIDAILVGPGGVFTVEVKAHRGSVRPDAIDPAMLRQAYAQAKWLERVTSARVVPLLVFTSAYLVGRPVSRQRGVTVLPARMLEGHLERRGSELSGDEVLELHRRLSAAIA